MTRSGAGYVRPFAFGVAVPVSIVAVAYVLWWTSDHLLYIGPLDRASFGWTVVIPTWLSAPILAGFAWARLTPRDASGAAVIVAAIVGGGAAVLLWLAISDPDCQFGSRRTPTDWALSSLLVGLAIGGGLAATGMVASRLVRSGHPWRAVIVGAGAELFLVFATVLLSASLLMGSACQRPPA